ncbi:lipoyl synthase [Sedimentisphaera salicampi]|uniref:lipoyl synthase n=1 Tax=Sedimentisphaera salicampi TaxID=1941349 RepID=UPI000B9C69BD|nr:lipoyl synthase [Sedimentisphaera salicampi]
MKNTNTYKKRFPSWLKTKISASGNYCRTERIIDSLGINTICVEANCPNKGECWSRGTASVLILGNICTRNCKFCSVPSGSPAPPDPQEPKKLSKLTSELEIIYLVITSVTRDDLPCGGAAHYRDTVLEIRKNNPNTSFELLTPDFAGCSDKALDVLAEALPFVYSHNIETVEELFPKARPQGSYKRSLELLNKFSEKFPEVPLKSSLMLGLGETDLQVEKLLRDLRSCGVQRVAMGQYLKPSKSSLDVQEFITPEKFSYLRNLSLDMGFEAVQASPFTRSSYMAESM